MLLARDLSLVGAMVLVGGGVIAVTTANSVHAQETCGAQFSELTAAINAATFTGQAEKTRASLLTKVTSAQEKLAQGKTADALQKLNDVRVPVSTLIESGKVTGGERIISAVDATVACINSGGAGSA